MGPQEPWPASVIVLQNKKNKKKQKKKAQFLNYTLGSAYQY